MLAYYVILGALVRASLAVALYQILREVEKGTRC